jgi:protein-S-isoprenylcysteine O-methyltransferase Ste14
MNGPSGRVWRLVNAIIYAIVGGGLVAVYVLLDASAQQLDWLPIGLYGGLFITYLLLERWAYRGSEGAGQQTHRWLRYALNLVWWAVMLAPVVEYILTGRDNPVVMGFGIVLAVAGMAIRMWGVRTLGRYFSGHIETYDDHQVVDTGPYGVIRHPAYAGNILHVVGMPLVLNAWLTLLLSAVLVVLFIRRLLWEEAELAERVPGYTDYQDRTARLIPGIW